MYSTDEMDGINFYVGQNIIDFSEEISDSAHSYLSIYLSILPSFHPYIYTYIYRWSYEYEIWSVVLFYDIEKNSEKLKRKL